MKKLQPLTKEEHLEFARALRKSQKILEPFMERINSAYGCKSKESKLLHEALRLLSSKICNVLDNHYYQLQKNEIIYNCPYYGLLDGESKVAWI